MSRAIKLTQRDLAYLRFGGSRGYQNQLETVRVKHESIGLGIFQATQIGINTTKLFIGHETHSQFSSEQVDTLSMLKEVAGEIGYKIEVSKFPSSKNSPARLLLKHDRAFTFDDLFGKQSVKTKELVYVARKDKT